LAHWSAFQTAIQLVAGLNVALYALPGLSRAELMEEASLFGEKSAVAKLVNEANQAGLFEAALMFQSKIQSHWQPMFRQFALARRACIIMAAATTIILLRGTGEWAELDADPRVAWGAIFVGFAPAGWLYLLNLQIESFRLQAARISRTWK
jgi:hypothetical protein